MRDVREETSYALIINLEKIYTMDMVNKHPLVFQHAFIAIHHERILAVGCGSWREYADKDTRILDGRGHIAVPGFIEVEAQLSTASKRDGLRRQLEEGMAYMRNGTLTLACRGGGAAALREQPCFEILDANPACIPVMYPYASLFQKNKKRLCRFCISAAGNYAIQDQLCAAQLMGMAEVYDAWTLLQALTVWPARALDRGELDISREMLGGYPFVCSHDIHALFHTLGNRYLVQVIKKGIRIFPDILFHEEIRQFPYSCHIVW